jgi:hypothetical protein
LYEGFGALDGPVDMAFGGKIDDGTRPVFGNQGGDRPGIGDVALHQAVARIVAQCGQIVRVAGVGQGVQGHHGLVAARQPVEYEVGADETGSAGDQDRHASFSS